MYCELCLAAVQELTSACPACGALKNVCEKPLLYPVNKWLDDQQGRWSTGQPSEAWTANCTMSNAGHANEGCSQKHHLHCDEADCSALCSAKMNVHDLSTHYDLKSPKKLKRIAINDDQPDHINTGAVIHSPIQEVVQNICNATSEDDSTLQLIEDALASGNHNLDQLNAFLETLDHLHSQRKQDEQRVEQSINGEFSKVLGVLQKRQETLQKELATFAEGYYAEIENAKKKIVEKLDDLKGAMQLARGSKETPSSRAYFNLNQVISRLKLPVKDCCSLVDDLKSRTCPGIHMNSEEIISALNHFGKFEKERANFPGAGGDTRKVFSDHGYPASLANWDTYLSLTDGFRSPVKHFKSDSLIPRDASATYALFNTKPKEPVLSLFQKSSTPISHTSSSPDVIIEEIIDEDGENFQPERISGLPIKLENTMTKSTNLSHPEKRASDQELVFVTHVVNPCHFYIQRYSKKKAANELEQKIAFYCSRNCGPSPNDVLVLGENIFVRIKEHSKWCRATITELLPLESKNVGKPCGPTKYEVKDISVMHVFLQDLGSSEVFIILGVSELFFMKSEHLNLQKSRVRDLAPHIRKINSLMESKMRSFGPLAVLCALKDIVPHNPEIGWREEVKEEFLKMVNNKVVLMKVFKEENGKLIVDLKKPRTNKITSDMPVSLRDALVFTELARFRSQRPRTPSEDQIVPRYFPPVLPQPMTEFSIAVIHTNSPADFYVQMFNTLDYLNLETKIKSVYTREEDNLEILFPIKGQACIALYENDWYRAEVIGLPGHREVEVKYIDFGNIEKVNVKNLRKVKDEFLSVPQKGIWCQLAHIEPFMHAAEWSEGAIKEFRKLVHENIMSCTVISILQDNKLSVELYDSKSLLGKSAISVNKLLVDADLATFKAGDSSSKNVDEIWDPALETMFCDSPYGSTLLEDDKDLASLKIREELPVRVSHVESANKIFVHWLSSENQLKRLQDELSDVYGTSKPEEIKWYIDMYCAVELPVLKQWRRGQIKQVISETHVKVFYFDYGIQEEVNVCCLRILTDNLLKKMGQLSVEISLKDIRPAGGSEKWTATACDFLKQYLTGSVAHLILEDKCSECPLMVKMFCNNESGQLVEVSDLLVKKGLALRERRTEPSQEACENHLDVVLESESSSSNGALPEVKYSSIPRTSDNLCITLEQPVITAMVTMSPYKSPCIPNTNTFEAEVSSVGEDGTIYVVQASLKKKLEKLMENMQNDLKFLGILEPYSWRKGEGCSIRGSDTMWYRGKVMEVVGGSVRVYYVDYGDIEKIPQCHLCPSVLYPEVPQFAIPCELHNILPFGDSWQQDAVELLREFLMKRCVYIHPVGQTEDAEGRIPIDLYCDGVSLSHFMEQHNHCCTKDYQNKVSAEAVDCNKEDLLNHWQNNLEDLLLTEYETPLLPRYTLPLLSCPGQLFPVTAKHLETPDELFISLDSKDCMNILSDTDDSGLSCNSPVDALELELQNCNQNIETLLPMHDFRSEMPCLAQYTDEQLYRAKLISIVQYDPVKIIVQHVDYGSSATLTTDRMFQIPVSLMQYPTRAIKVKLKGFKPPLDDGETKRIPYRPAWSMEALYVMMDYLDGKQLYASTVSRFPEPSIFLYEDDKELVHLPLINKGLAELDD